MRDDKILATKTEIQYYKDERSEIMIAGKILRPNHNLTHQSLWKDSLSGKGFAFYDFLQRRINKNA